MAPTHRTAPTPDERSRSHAIADAEWQLRRSLTAVRERLRVARLRAADRQRLADNAGAAGQEGFEGPLRSAADAHVATARALEETMRCLERCWARIEDQRRIRERAAITLRAATVVADGGLDLDARDGD